MQTERCAELAENFKIFLPIHGRGDVTLASPSRFARGRPQVSPTDTHINIGRGHVFSADLCYNEANEKPPSEMPSASGCGGTRSVTEGACVTLGLY